MLVSDSLTDSLTHSLTDSCLVNLIDVTLACEDANSKLVEIVTVAGVDAKELKFSHKNKFLSRLCAQDFGKRF